MVWPRSLHEVPDMRWSALGLIALTLAGCGSKLKPEGPAIDNWERVRGWSENAPSKARYGGPPLVASPVVPVLAYGAHFDIGLVTRPKSDRWDQIEVGRLATPSGPQWLAIETRDNNEQILHAKVGQLDALMPELPLQRRSTAIEVQDQSSADTVKFDIQYKNADGDPVAIQVESSPPQAVEAERNVPVPGHSADTLLALVDAGAQENAFSVTMKIGGETQNMEKEGGMVPYQYVASRTHGGLAIGSFTLVPTQVFSFDSTLSEVVVRKPGDLKRVVQQPAKADPLTAALARQREDFQGCYSASAKKNAGVAGQVLLAFTVDGGKASDLKVVNNSTADQALADCLTQKLAEFSFPADISGPTAYPFLFVAKEGLQLPVAGSDAPVAPAAPAPVPEPEDEELPDDFAIDAPAPAPAAPAEEPAVADGEALDDESLETLDSGATRVVPEWAKKIATFRTEHSMPSGNTVDLEWDVSRRGDRVFAVQRTDVRELTYEYLIRHDSLELLRVAVTQYGRATPNTEISFSPALPDLRRPFSGRQQSRFVIDVGGQGNYAVGTAEAWWTDTGVKLKLVPEGPEWAVGRTMTTTIQYGTDKAKVVITRAE